MKFLRFLFGLMLIPLCAAVTRTALHLVQAIQPHRVYAVPPSAWALSGGYLAWLLIYFTLPRPARTYVLAHELTHALWGWVMGARVLRMNVSKDRGSVTLSKSNVFITLAPYFFPLYTMVVIVGYYALSLFLSVERYALCWLALVGFTWGFHFTFTVSTLLQRQSDIREYGHLFSYTVIYLCNVLGICFWVVLISSPTLGELASLLGANLQDAAAFLVNAGWWIVDRTRDIRTVQ